MKIQTSKWLMCALCASLVSLTGCAKLKSRDQMNQGVQAYKNNHYAEAVRHFKEAVTLDPTNQNAQLYLATSYMIQWVPGAESPDNKKNYDMAKQEFDEVLKKDPSNSLALASLASMAFNSAASGTPEQKAAALEEARKWNQRRIEVDPKDPEPYYYLGVISWSQTYPPYRDARAAANMKDADPGPLKDAKVRDALKEKYGRQIEDGINNLTKALALDKENEDAMVYVNLLLREKALVLDDSEDAAKADVAQAEDWYNRSIDTKKMKANRPQKKAVS
ncbi:MAG TPA: tetratricopeptide repeat protein [Bryobacteraceae bacterium]